ncbi:transposase [Paenibacillus pini]
MLFWIIASFIVIPFVMAFVSALSIIFRTIIHALALLSIYVSGSIVAAAIYRTRSHDTELTTDVHHVLLNPWFLFTGAYLGLYVPYLIMTRLWKEQNQ